MAVLPDPAGSQALLVGVASYTTLEQLPAVANNLTGLRAALTDLAIWGLPAKNCTVQAQPESADAVLDTLQRVASSATDTLVVYFAGHGLVDPMNDEELYLALPGSDKERAYRTALPYSWVRREMQASRVRRKVVILDCCYSGRAIGRWMGDGQAVLADLLEIDGTCVLTATARTRKALALPNERFTAFTGELIAILDEGIPGGPELLDMATIYRYLTIRLRAKSLPVPQHGQMDHGGNIAIGRNRTIAQPFTLTQHPDQGETSGPGQGLRTQQPPGLRPSAVRGRKGDGFATRSSLTSGRKSISPPGESLPVANASGRAGLPMAAKPDTVPLQRNDGRSPIAPSVAPTGPQRFAKAGPALAPPFRVTADAGSPGTVSRPRRGPAKGLMLVASGVVAVSLIVIAALHSLGSGPSPTGSVSLYSSDSYGFSNPDSIAVDGHSVWVANLGGSVAELNADNGNLLRTLSNRRYGFSSPEGIAADGNHIWVTNLGGGANGHGSVTELNARDGSLVRTLSGGSYGFNGPWGIATDGTDVWVANYGHPGVGNSVTELNASNGTLIRTLHGFKYPFSVAVGGPHVWVANGNSVTELNASNGSLVRTLSGHRYRFSGIQAIAADGTHLWAASYGGGAGGNGSVTEVNASNGAVAHILSDASYSFNHPQGITSDGTHVWVAANGESVAELNASNGSLVRILSGGSYGFSNPWSIAVNGTHVWVANHQGNSVTEFPTG